MPEETINCLNCPMRHELEKSNRTYISCDRGSRKCPLSGRNSSASVIWSFFAVLLMIALGFAVNECEGYKRAERVANGNRIRAEYKADSLQIVNGKVIDSFARRSEWKDYRNTHDDKEINAKIKRDKVERLKPNL